MKGLSKSINNKQIIKDTWLSFLPGAKIGIIGPNGAGKSTLLRIISGETDYEGEAWVADGIRIGYLPQEPRLDHSKTVYENILDGTSERISLVNAFNEISNKFLEELTNEEMENLLLKQAELQEKIDAIDGWSVEREVEIAMSALRCPPKDAKILNISGGERRRVALCKLLLEKPDMLLLDEPTNHLDSESVSWLEEYLKQYKGTIILITHDRYFLDNVVEWILEIDHGKCIPYRSNYSDWLAQKHAKLELEEKEESARRKHLKNELEWIRQSPKARQSKSKARVNAYQELLSQRIDRSSSGPQITIHNGPRLGEQVIEIVNVSKNIGHKSLFRNFSCSIPRGAIVGIIGPNGAGKSTLLKMIAGITECDAGEIITGQTVKLGYVDQHRDHLDNTKSIWEEISGGLEEFDFGDAKVKSRAYCASFNFKGSDQQKIVGQLSGGERNRVHIAKLLKEGANVIMLDEPSNDLDLDTIRALEDAILNFTGCVLIVTHDRWFLDRIATHIISVDPILEKAIFFDGNYSDYHSYCIKVHGCDINNPKYKHKKLIS